MKKKLLTYGVLLVFLAGMLFTSCRNRQHCPGMYGVDLEHDQQLVEQV